MTGNSAYLTGLDRNQANYTPLTPLTFLERAAYVYPDRPSVIHGVAALHLARDLCALPPSRIGAGAARHRQERHRRDDGAEHPGDV